MCTPPWKLTKRAFSKFWNEEQFIRAEQKSVFRGCNKILDLYLSFPTGVMNLWNTLSHRHPENNTPGGPPPGRWHFHRPGPAKWVARNEKRTWTSMKALYHFRQSLSTQMMISLILRCWLCTFSPCIYFREIPRCRVESFADILCTTWAPYQL